MTTKKAINALYELAGDATVLPGVRDHARALAREHEMGRTMQRLIEAQQTRLYAEGASGVLAECRRVLTTVAQHVFAPAYAAKLRTQNMAEVIEAAVAVALVDSVSLYRHPDEPLTHLFYYLDELASGEVIE